MADPAGAPFSINEGYNLLQKLYEGSVDKEGFNQICRRVFISQLYKAIISGPDPDAVSLLQEIRKFFTTSTSASVQFQCNGITWDINPGYVYCCSNEEWSYIKGLIEEQNLTLTEQTFETWNLSYFKVQSYFWS